MIYYIADLHLGHENVIRFDGRPFESAEEMETVLVEKWNRKVTNADTVYIVGDFIWKKENEWKNIVPKFNGRKILIRGNHDPKKFSLETKLLFADIKDYIEIADNERRVILCHYPILMYNHSFENNTYMLCGHVHVTQENTLLEEFRRKIKKTKGPKGNIYNVGCMMPWMDYEPRTLDEIVERYVPAEPVQKKRRRKKKEEMEATAEVTPSLAE